MNTTSSTPIMLLLDLPPEILSPVIHVLVEKVNVKSAMRYREVCSTYRWQFVNVTVSDQVRIFR
jgi:hypothetical protein